MSDEPWRRLKRVFHDAVALPADARAAFLDRECAGDAALRAEVESLLASHAEADDFLSRPAVISLAPTLEGRRIGPYRVLGEIGRGGMGVVHRAVRDDDAFQKTVALKVVRGSGAWSDVEHRLERERQILARLQHPNIAAVFDGGTTGDGQPYLVMELVEGRPITGYCAAHGLGTRARLGMIRAVCDALQYAHRNLVIHRDIKPGNILVGDDGRPKLLDFGIAKLLAAGVDPDTAPTATMLPMMTPEYASPEQVRGEAVTTSSDVYSLGVVMYELLTGERPYAVPTDSLEGIVRAVCESDPAAPSTIAGRSDAATRPAPPRELRGDVDTIVLKALRKEPARRYLTAQDLSEDVRRHLEGLPVLARADTLGYRVSKYTRRHKVAVVAAVLVTASLLGGIAATWRQARLAEANRRRAERRFDDVRKLSNSFLFEFHDAIKDLPGSTPAREIVVTRGLEYLDGLAAEAHGNPSLQLELASAYEKVGDLQGALGQANLGQTPAAHKSYAKAVALREAATLAAPSLEARRDLATARKKLASMRMAEGDWPGAIGLFEQVRDFHVALAAQRPDDFAAQVDANGSSFNVGIAVGLSGRSQEGLDICEAGQAGMQKLSEKAPNDAQVRNKIGIGWIWIGNLATAIPSRRVRAVEAFREGAALYEKLAAAEPDNAFWRLKLGDTQIGAAYVLSQLARWDEAAAAGRRARSLYLALETADPKSDYYRQERVAAQWLLARALLERGDLASAEPLLTDAERVMLEQYTAQPENVLLRERLAGAQASRGRYYELTAARAVGPARAKQLQLALDWSRKAERHLAELESQGRLPVGASGDLGALRRRIAECEAALGR